MYKEVVSAFGCWEELPEFLVAQAGRRGFWGLLRVSLETLLHSSSRTDATADRFSDQARDNVRVTWRTKRGFRHVVRAEGDELRTVL
ncbi:unnamed protein product [Protopolystoma xenopodis]|uniref:Uncharacterized protein n=1 Tax=Protopolystoma xenopodis TaxID=117903 RepID=A0A3S5FEJ9_9PLAT|nr:unnamed protein product [Protopolystoma xenopodis]